MTWYNDAKGFGFIAPDRGGKDIFVHASALQRSGIMGLAEGQRVVVDMAGVEHMSASALMALTIARKEAITSNVKIVLARPTPEMREVLEISRYQLIFDIVDDLDMDGG